MTRFHFRLALAAFLAAAPLLFAQQEAGRPAGGEPVLRRLTNLIGSRVLNRTGDVEGRLRDVLFTRGGGVTHLVVRLREVGEGIEIRNRDYLVPLDRMAAGAARDDLVILDLATRDILDLRMLENGRPPEDLFPPAAVAPILGRELLRYSFVGADGRGLGGVEDVMLDLPQRRVAYLLLAAGGFLGIGEALFAVPLSRIVSVDASDRQLILDIRRDQMQELESFGRDQEPAEPRG